MGIVVLLAFVVILGALFLVVTPWRKRVAISAVNRFARRQRLPITTANGGHVLRAMAVSFRWRRVGLVVGFGMSIAVSIPQGRLTIWFLALFLGWFAGAVVAEWRVSALPVEGTRRAASIGRRSLARYVTTPNRRLLLGAGALLALTILGGLARVVVDGAGFARWSWTVALTLVGALLLAITLRRVVDRPQSAGDPSLVEADDALRGHSLTVLTGSAIAAAGFAAGELTSHAVPGTGGGLLGFAVLVVAALVGWWVAARSPSARALAPQVSVPHTATA